MGKLEEGSAAVIAPRKIMKSDELSSLDTDIVFLFRSILELFRCIDTFHEKSKPVRMVE